MKVTVTAEEWTAALNYNTESNYTVTMYETYNGATSVGSIYKFIATAWYERESGGGSSSDYITYYSITSKNDDGTYAGKYYVDRDQTGDRTWKDSTSLDRDENCFLSVYNVYIDNFEYSDTTHAYSASGINIGEAKFDMTIKFENGKVVDIVMTLENGEAEEMHYVFTDYGTTTVTLPEGLS